MIEVLVPGVLRADAGGAARLAVAMDPALVLTAGEAGADMTAAGTVPVSTLGAVLDEIGLRWPLLERRIRDERGSLRRYVNVYVDGEDCRFLGGLATPVRDGAEIQVLPSVAGG